MNSSSNRFFVSEAEHGMRLDLCIARAMGATYSRSAIAAAIKEGAATINGRSIPKTSHPVQQGDEIVFTMPQPPLLAMQACAVPFEVIAEEEDFLVINKPAGLAVHPAPSAPEAITLVHGLLARYPEFSCFESNERPGIVHRIDKDTSGLLLVARNPQALTRLAALFKTRAITKIYHAIVVGSPAAAGIINKPIGRSFKQRHLMSIGGIAPRNATTHYRILEGFDLPAALLELRIVTGRTHQIRVHCAHEGFPLLGDALYGTASKRIGRQALHAAALSFTYEGKEYAFTAPAPDDFAAVITDLRSKTTRP